MLGNVEPTQYDLRFTIFGIPVRVHPLFWVLSIMVLRGCEELDLIFVGVCCIFLSILVHELGHALVTKWFGWSPNIVLYYFGGVAQFLPDRGFTPLRSILISLAGPFAGFLLWGLTWAGVFAIVLFGVDHHISPAGNFALNFLIWINLYWTLFNLLPIYPLDGGQVARALFSWMMPNRGLSESLKLSILTGFGAGAFLVLNEYYFAALYCIAFALVNFQELQERSRYG
ncbi:Stage IV sporulation protein FB [Symmachiella dynata]|uniref:Stage IV sporulation protein FB n=1 Tax=Symmachiella dynata TaxID=2527995 RepID=A0A517ZSG8_9PLAN|nr:site-2 protease family protein [Symmachiella dynata]QDU45428.1 Stage IV sporulation protein FB [Symmachiella dynata]